MDGIEDAKIKRMLVEEAANIEAHGKGGMSNVEWLESKYTKQLRALAAMKEKASKQQTSKRKQASREDR